MTDIHHDLDSLLDKVCMEDLLDTLAPKERDTISLWLNGGYSREEIAIIIQARYNDKAIINGKIVGTRIQLILSKLKESIKGDL